MNDPIELNLDPKKHETFDGRRIAKALKVPIEVIEQYGMSGCLIEKLVKRIEDLTLNTNQV